MKKTLKMALTIARLMAVPGIIIGPVFLVKSYFFFSRLRDFQENGKETNGKITAIYSNDNPRYTSYFLDLNYQVEDHFGVRKVRAERVDLYFVTRRKLKADDPVKIYYKPGSDASDVLLAANYYPENVPLHNQAWWGWIITIFSVIFFFSHQIGKSLKKRTQP